MPFRPQPRPEWHIHSLRSSSYPDHLSASPTVSHNVVFASFHQAMMHLLFTTMCAKEGVVQCHPRGLQAFPQLVVDGLCETKAADDVDGDDALSPPQKYAVHLLTREPGPGALMLLAEELATLDESIHAALLVLGPLLPSTETPLQQRHHHHRHTGGSRPPLSELLQNETPYIRIILMRRQQPSSGAAETLLQTVEHCWHLCNHAGGLCLAFQGRLATSAKSLLPAATVPTYGVLLQKKKQHIVGATPEHPRSPALAKGSHHVVHCATEHPPGR